MTRTITTLVRKPLTLLLCVALAAPGCAASRASGVTAAPQPQAQVADRAVLADYIQRLPLGSAIRLDFTNRKSLRGTLLKAGDRTVVVQPRTRVPEPPIEIQMADVMRVTLDTQTGTGIGKAIGIGAAAGAGAALAVLLILIAVLD